MTNRANFTVSTLTTFAMRTCSAWAFCLFVVLGTLAGQAIFAPAAEAANRSLTLYNTHTKEKATITYKRNGKFDANGLRKLNRFLRDWRRNEIIQMDPNLFDLIWQVYKETGARKPIHVVSGYRSPATNNMLRSRSRGVAKASRHTKGQAMDFYLPGVPVSKIRRVGLRMQAGGVGYYPTSNSPFVHIDTGTVRHWPRMTRKQLARVFPNGVTVHVPTDRKPLKGYKRAKQLVARKKAAMARAKRNVGRFTQVVRAAPSRTSNRQVAKLAQQAKAKQQPNFLASLLKTTPKARPTPAPAPAIAKSAVGTSLGAVESANSALRAPLKLAALPKPRARRSNPAPVTPANIDLAADGNTPQKPAEPDRLAQPLRLATLPKARPAFDDTRVAAAPINLSDSEPATGSYQLASLPRTSPSRDDALAGFQPVEEPTASIAPTQNRLIPQPGTTTDQNSTVAAQLNRTEIDPPAPATGAQALAKLTGQKEEEPLAKDRFAYASPNTALTAGMMPKTKPGSAGADVPLPKAAQRQQLASLPNAKPAFEPATPKVQRQVAKPAQKAPTRRTSGPNRLAKLTFAYGPSGMAHFAHMKQSAKSATFARLSKPRPGNLDALMTKPTNMINQGFSRGPLNQVGTASFAGRAIAKLPVRSFN